MEPQAFQPAGAFPARPPSRFYPRALLALFLLSLPLVNPIVHGDGVGYYAYARAPLIQHNLRFEEDWQHANLNFVQSRTLPGGQLDPSQYTQTGYVDNLFSIGPAILWSPFLILTHLLVLLCNAFGAHIPADGFSAPYRFTMAFVTALYGFLGLFFSYSLARKYVQDKWAFLATLGIWAGSSLPVYMYFNPAWSHAHSAFAVAVFLWYWERTRPERSFTQWMIIGLIAGLMVDVYFPNGVFFLVPFIEALRSYSRLLSPLNRPSVVHHFLGHMLFCLAIFVAILPTLVTRYIIFGGLFRFGAYTQMVWNWFSPTWLQVLFSSDHGLLSWTPILALALLGLFLPSRSARAVALYLLLCAAAFYYVIASYPYWDGLSSFGNRFFISLTPVFVFGLALFFERADRVFTYRRWFTPVASALVACFVLWNAGLIYQWGAHLISPRGPVDFSEVAHNQFSVVPRQIRSGIHAYLFRRKALMQEIEERDIQQLKDANPPN